MKYARIKMAKWGDDLQRQLEIRKGRIVFRNTGKPPLFKWPDGMIVNVCPRDALVECVDAAQLGKHWGA